MRFTSIDDAVADSVVAVEASTPEIGRHDEHDESLIDREAHATDDAAGRRAHSRSLERFRGWNPPGTA